MGPSGDVFTYGPNVADNVAWIELWGGWAMLAVAGLMALAVARELWPLVRLRLAPRNRLVPGRCLVDGVIEPGAVESPVIVEIDQERSHWAGSRALDRYIERQRRVSLHPFVLRLDDGRRVRVIPDGEHVTLLCRLRQGIGFGWRTSKAKVSVGDRVLVEGEVAPASLAAPYRETAANDVVELRPLREMPLWVAVEGEARSTMRRAAAFYATLMLGLLVTCVVAQRSAGLRDLREMAANGQVVDAKVVSADASSDGQQVLVRAALPDGHMVAAWMNRSFVPVDKALSAGEFDPGSTVRWTYVPTRPSLSMPGEMECAEPNVELLICLVWVGWLGAMWIYWRSFRPWYRRYNVNQTRFW